MPGTYEPISTTTLGSNATSITLGTGGTIPQTNTDLVLIINASGYYASATYIEGGVQVGNGTIDTGNNYSFTGADINVAFRQTSTPYSKFYCTATPTNIGIYGPTIVQINNYSNTNVNKTFLTRYSGVQNINTVNTTGWGIGMWRSTSAINIIKVSNFNGTDFYAGTNITLYGIKAA